MKFSLATITAFAGAISAASLPSAFTLVAEGGKTVLTDGQNAYINANTTDHEILIRKHTPFWVHLSITGLAFRITSHLLLF